MLNKNKEKISFEERCHIEDVRCSRCTHWGFNKGLVLYGSGGSRCTKGKTISYGYQYCHNFSLLKGVEE